MKKSIFTIFFLLFFVFSFYSQSCLPNGITFTSQAQINAFPTNYPGCTNILGNVKINGSNITNLNGLSQIQSIGGNFDITRMNASNLIGLNSLTSIGGNLMILGWANSTPNLNSLNGLNNLTSIGESLIIQGLPSLTNIEALTSLSSLNGKIDILSNGLLTSLNGLQNIGPVNDISISGNSLTTLYPLQFPISMAGGIAFGENLFINLNVFSSIQHIGGGLSISGMNNISDLSGLENLESVGGTLRITSNANLVNLNGLENLVSIDYLQIYLNGNLLNLDGLQNLSTVNYIEIQQNANLTNCAIQSICDFLSLNGNYYIGANIPDCNSKAQILAQCNSTPPACTGLSGPYPGNTEIPVNTNISWSDATNLPGAGYYISIGTSPGASDILTNTDVGDVLTYDPVNNLPYNTTIYVKISPYNVNGINATCTEQSFTTGGACPTYIYLTTQNEVNNFPINYPDCQNAIYIEIGGAGIVDLSPLNQITSFSEALFIYETGISNLNAFPNLTSTVNSGLYIFSNPLLSSITGFNNLNTVGFLYIEGNPQLTNCEAEGICNILEITPEVVYIGGNATGCNTNEEVIEACGIILPLNLLSFEALKSKSNVIIKWNTTAEKSMSHFSIQRSPDAKEWENIGEVEANNEVSGTNTYSFIDDQPLKGTSYYRLRINDMDGNFEYSPVRSVYFGSDIDEFEAFGSDKSITILSENQSGKHYIVYNSIGKKVAESNERTIPVSGSGFYLVTNGLYTKKVFVK